MEQRKEIKNFNIISPMFPEIQMKWLPIQESKENWAGRPSEKMSGRKL
jgi:hypothetical protein